MILLDTVPYIVKGIGNESRERITDYRHSVLPEIFCAEGGGGGGGGGWGGGGGGKREGRITLILWVWVTNIGEESGTKPQPLYILLNYHVTSARFRSVSATYTSPPLIYECLISARFRSEQQYTYTINPENKITIGNDLFLFNSTVILQALALFSSTSS